MLAYFRPPVNTQNKKRKGANPYCEWLLLSGTRVGLGWVYVIKEDWQFLLEFPQKR